MLQVEKLLSKQLTKDEHVQAGAQGPYVGQAGLVRLPAAHFRRHEGGRSSRPVDQVAHPGQLRAAEVGNFQVAIRSQEKVVGLQVPVCDLVGVEVAQALQADVLSSLERAFPNTCKQCY